jgi:radical SAM protein with 4Fe4S-binding SPASM domain
VRSPGSYRELLDDASLRRIPFSVSIELTHRCNFRCRHCYLPDLTAPDVLPAARILGLLEELVAEGTLFLTLTGGEPLLRKEWWAIARRARELGLAVRLLTNGSLVDEETADRLRAVDAAVEVSVHAATAGPFEEVTRRAGSLDATLAGVRRLRERGLRVLMKVPVTLFSRPEVEGVFDLAERLGAECRADHRIIHGRDGGLGPLSTRVPEEEMRDFYRSPQYSGPRPGLVSEDRPGGPPCAAGVRYACVAANGDVLACNVMPRPAGNVLVDPFGTIWRESAWFRELREVRWSDLRECAGCGKAAYCSRCPATALVEDGDLRGPSSSACAHAAALERAGLPEAESP